MFKSVLQSFHSKSEKRLKNAWWFHFKAQFWGVRLLSCSIVLREDDCGGVWSTMCSVSCSSQSEMIQAFWWDIILLEWADGCAAAINRRIWLVIILRLQHFNSAQLLLKGGPPPLQPHSHPQVDTSMFYVVYSELWPFTCHRINHDSTH